MWQAEKKKQEVFFLYLKIKKQCREYLVPLLGLFPISALEKLHHDLSEATHCHTERLIESFANQFQLAVKKRKQDSLPFGCLFWLKAWISMGEKILECISRRFSPEYLLQAKIECVFQSVQYNVSPNSVSAKGCGREPLTTACLTEYRKENECSNATHATVFLEDRFCEEKFYSVNTPDQNYLFINREQA